MEQSPHSAQQEQQALTAKLLDLLAEETTQLPFQEEMVEEVMQDLYKEIATEHSVSPVSPTFLFGDGKNGSCGAAVSASASTVMAGIEVAGSGGGFLEAENAVAVVDGGDNGGGDALDLLGFGEDCVFDFDVDDEWVGRVLSWGEQNQVRKLWD